MPKLYLRQRVKILWPSLAVEWMDIRARLRGYCNDCPWSADSGYRGGGYSHWRCALRRGHKGLHRYRNYVWGPYGETTFVPVPDGRPLPQQPYERLRPNFRQVRRQWRNKIRMIKEKDR